MKHYSFLLPVLFSPIFLFAQNPFESFGKTAFIDAQVLAQRKNSIGNNLDTGIVKTFLNAEMLDTVMANILLDNALFFENPFNPEINSENLGEANFDPAWSTLSRAVSDNQKEKAGINNALYPFLQNCYSDLPGTLFEFQNNLNLVIAEDMLECAENDQRKSIVQSDSYFLALQCNPALPSEIEDFKNPETTFSWDDWTCYNDLNKVFKRKKWISEANYSILQVCDPLLNMTYTALLKRTDILISDQALACYMEQKGFVLPGQPCIKDPVEGDFLDVDGDGEGDCPVLAESDFEEDMEMDVNIIKGFSREESPSINGHELSGGIAVSSGAGSVGLTTQIIDGAARFLVERVQQELTSAFFDKLLKRMESKPELGRLFPNTFLILRNQEYFRVPSMGEVWLSAFETDIRSFVDNFQVMVEEEPQFEELRKEQAYQAIAIISSVGSDLLQSKSFSDILAGILPYGNNESILGKSISFVGILMENLTYSEDGLDYLVSNIQFSNLSKLERKYFAAIIFQKEKSLLSAINAGQFSLASIIGQNPESFNHAISGLLELVGNFEIKVKSFKEQRFNSNSDSSGSKVQIGEIVDLGFETLEYCLSLKYYSQPQEWKTSNEYKVIFQTRDNLNKVQMAFRQKELGLAFLYTLNLVVPVLEGRIERLSNNISSNPNKEAKQQIERLSGILRFIHYYGGFMVDVVRAGSANQIKEILKKYALPAGSYRIKRSSPFSVELNAFPGLYIGKEIAGQNEVQASVWGITAPAGISINKGRNGWSYSLFIPVIDLGAPFSYRWNSASDDEGFPEEIRWEQIISPGGHIVIGIKDIPLSIMAGAQFTPKLRGISDTGLDLKPENTWRFGFTATIDIPVAKFYQQRPLYRSRNK